jgi:hypothetical protein
VIALPLHKAADIVELKVSPAEATRVFPPAAVSQAAPGNVAQAVWVEADASTVAAATPYPRGIALIELVPSRDSAAKLPEAGTSSVAFSVN